MEKRFLECNCQATEHVVVFSWVKGEDDPRFQHLYIESQLSTYLGFFRRIWAAFKYVFGFGKAGWDCCLLFKGEAINLRDTVNEYIAECDKYTGSVDLSALDQLNEN